MRKVVISLIDYKGQQKTDACLSSLDQMRFTNMEVEVVVIDNFPSSPFKSEKKYKNFQMTILRPEKNLGFAGGHNLGIQYAKNKDVDFVVVLNNDTTVDENLLVELIRPCEKDAKIGAVVPKIYFMKGHEYHKDRYKQSDLGKVIWYAGGHMDWDNINGVHEGVDEVDKGQFDQDRRVDLLTGCCVLFTKSALQAIGGFNESYFLYYEDADLNERLKKEGFKIHFAAKAHLWHLNAGSTGGSGSVLQDYFISRNRLLFGMRFASHRTKIALVRESLRILATGREWQKIGVKDFYRRKFGKGSFGL
jgi:GT2 family glycosyltransferase